MCRFIQTLVDPSTRYQSMADCYGDSQVIEVLCVPDGGQGFDSLTGCYIAHTHMYPVPYDRFLTWPD